VRGEGIGNGGRAGYQGGRGRGGRGAVGVGKDGEVWLARSLGEERSDERWSLGEKGSDDHLEFR
jgi:hypothetical protein